jgi:hypothetical protein
MAAIVRIFRKIRDELLGTIVVVSLPKKAKRDSQPLGGILPSPWRGAANQTLYTRIEAKALRLYIVNELSGKKSQVTLN